MTHAEAGRKGGLKTLERHGKEHFQRIGQKGTWQEQVAQGWAASPDGPDGGFKKGARGSIRPRQARLQRNGGSHEEATAVRLRP